MKKINQYKLLAGICALSLFTACDFEELNTNPFEMTDEMGIRDGVAVGGAVMAMQRAVITVGTQADDTEAINQYQVAYNLSADSWSGFFGQNNNWYSGSNNTTYYLQDNWVAATYTNSYTTLLSSWKKIKQESEKNETPEIFALAQILKISAWHKTLESFGPIPYTHAGEPALVIPFDSEQVAFNAMFADLTAAIEALTVRAEQGATIVADYDAVYSGDTRKWVKYANSLMLRLAMRISYADETTAQKYARQALNHPFGVMTSKSDEAQMSTGAGMQGRAPEALAGLPAPDVVFIGGTGGGMAGVVDAALARSPSARICISAIALETLSAAAAALTAHGLAAQVTQVAVSRTRPAGGLHLLMANNPVFLVTGNCE